MAPRFRHMSINTFVLFHQVAQVINKSLEEHFPERSVRVVAEPGRYFAAAAFTLAAMVHTKREVFFF